MRDLNIFYQERPDAVFGLRSLLFFYIFIRHSLFLTRRTAQMDELNPTVREQEIYEEMEQGFQNRSRAERRQEHGCLHCLSDPARSRLRCHAPLMPVLHSN